MSFFLSFENVMPKFHNLFAYSGTESSCNLVHSDWFFPGQDFAIPVRVGATLHKPLENSPKKARVLIG